MSWLWQRSSSEEANTTVRERIDDKFSKEKMDRKRNAVTKKQIRGMEVAM